MGPKGPIFNVMHIKHLPKYEFITEESRFIPVDEIVRGLVVGRIHDVAIVLGTNVEKRSVTILFRDSVSTEYFVSNPVNVHLLVDETRNQIILTEEEITWFILKAGIQNV